MCPADKGEEAVETALARGSKNTILTRIHRKLMSQLKSMHNEDFKEKIKFTVAGPVTVSMALLIKLHKKNISSLMF